MDPIEVFKWLIPGSVVAAALLTVWRWLTRSWRSDMELRASKLKELGEFEYNIESAYGRNNIRQFRPLINKVKRPMLEITATRMIVLSDKNPKWDIVLYFSGGLIVISALISLFDVDTFWAGPLGAVAALGFIGMGIFIIVMILDEQRARRKAKSLVSKILDETDEHLPLDGDYQI